MTIKVEIPLFGGFVLPPDFSSQAGTLSRGGLQYANLLFAIPCSLQRLRGTADSLVDANLSLASCLQRTADHHGIRSNHGDHNLKLEIIADHN